jgi:hypothetical protein
MYQLVSNTIGVIETVNVNYKETANYYASERKEPLYVYYKPTGKLIYCTDEEIN